MAVKERKARKAKLSKQEEVIEEEDTTSELETRIGACLVFLLSCIIYGITMFPGLPMGDSGEFMSTAIDFGVAHPPGYPLFTTLCYLAINLLPFGTPAFRVNLLSVVFGALFNVVTYYIVSKLGKNSIIGFLTAGWLGFSRLFWMWSIQGEIFSLNNFFCAYIMLQAYYFETCKKEDTLKEAKISALICGLSLSNQHTSILFIFPFALRVAFKIVIIDSHSLKDAAIIAAYGMLGMAWYIQLPISYFFFKPRVSWGEFGTVGNFLQHMLRLDYGSSFKLVAGDSKGTFFTNFTAFVKDSSTELSLLSWVMFIFLYSGGFAKFSNTSRNTLKVITLMLVCYFAVFCSLANIDNPEGLSRGVLERFWMQPSIGLIVLAGVGLCQFLLFLSEKVHPIFKNRLLQLTLALLLVSVQIKKNYAENDESENYYAHHYAKAILTDLPENSIMLTGGDLPTNVFRYHTICEQMRPDVHVMDMQFMAASWYETVLAPTTFAAVNIPGIYRPYPEKQLIAGQYNLKMFLDLNYDKFPIFICNTLRADESSHKADYQLINYRTCQRFYKRKDVDNPAELMEKSPSTVLFDWPMPDIQQYEDRTWEHTLFTTYLSSLSWKGTQLWDEAIKTQHPGNRRYLLEHGLKYMEAAVGQVERAIGQGSLPDDELKPMIAEPLYKNTGHFCMILWSMIDKAEDAENRETRMQSLEHCGRKYWKLYIDWYPHGVKGDPYIAEIRKFLGLKTFKGLNFNI